MITAAELREIAEVSQRQIDAILARIEPELKLAAEENKRHYACYKQTQWESVRIRQPAPKPTRVQQRLIDELKVYGFNARVEADGEPYTPRSFDEEDLHQNYVLVIHW